MGTVALDSSVVIGFLTADDAQHDKAVGLLGARLRSGDRLLMPATVYAEILMHHLRTGTDHVIDAFVEDTRIEIVQIDPVIARRAAALRAVHEALRLPDALVLAIAIHHEADLVTLDERLRRLSRRPA